MSNIRKIPGVGDKTARRLIEHFASEAGVIEAFRRHDVAAIAGVPGISGRNAAAMVQAFIFSDEDISPDDFLRTGESRRVYRELLDIIASYTCTAYAREKLNIYFPLPASKKDRIMSVRSDVAEACRMTETIASGESGIEDLRDALKNVGAIKDAKPAKVRDRVIITAGHEEYQQLRERLGRWIDIILADSPGELADAAAGYSHVTASMNLAGIDLPHDSNIEYTDLSALETHHAVPELMLAFFSQNLATIQSAVRAYNITKDAKPGYFSGIPASAVESLGTALKVVGPGGGVNRGSDRELDRTLSAMDRLDKCVKSAEQKANAQFREYLENSTVTLTGKDLLDAVAVKDLVDREMTGRYRDIVKATISGIAGELDLVPNEALLLDDLFSIEVSTSIEANRDAVGRLRRLLEAGNNNRSLELLREAAGALADLNDTARQLVWGAMELDLWLSIGLFARDRGLVIPLIHDGTGFEVWGGNNLFLAGDVEPVDYALGELQPGTAADGYTPERAAVLSGVNSGGKTSTLDLLSLVLVLSHMGFPVPAGEASLGLVDELYYFGKSRGTMDAGAFESTLQEFSVVSGTGRMVILADELESITEPGASARIIGGILESITENPNALGVFVSHLAESIMEHTTADVRVDGIEAAGLDNDLNLVVERSPRYNYVAKSTPELIVERLVRQAEGVKRDFYSRLLEKFK